MRQCTCTNTQVRPAQPVCSATDVILSAGFEAGATGGDPSITGVLLLKRIRASRLNAGARAIDPAKQSACQPAWPVYQLPGTCSGILTINLVPFPGDPSDSA
jgi:hypothetical protein